MAYNTGQGLKGAAGGAATGATIGSVVPGIGTAVGAVIGGGLGLLGGFGGGKKKDEFIEPFPGYRALGGDLSGYLRNNIGKLGTPYGGPFTSTPGAVEGATTNSVLGRLATVGDFSGLSSGISDIYKRVYQSEKDRQAESFDEERRKTQQRYNRLGLSSSTSGFQALQDVDRKQATAEENLAAEIGAAELNAEFQAQALADQLFNSAVNSGIILGGQETQRRELGINRSIADFTRVQNQPLTLAQISAGLLGSSSPAYIDKPSTGDQLLGVGSDIGTLLLMSKLGLGGGGGGA